MFAEEFVIVDADAPLWQAARPLLEAALRLEQNDETYRWHGWSKQQIEDFLKSLPEHCTVMVGVWQTIEDEQTGQERELLVLGGICEVSNAQVTSIRTFAALSDPGLPSVNQIEPGFEDARELMRLARLHIAPVAWALFTDQPTWNEWLFAEGDEGAAIDKGELLSTFARQGRCVLMGSQTLHRH